MPSWSANNPILEVRDEEALERLQEAVADEYKIVVKEDISDYRPADGSVGWRSKPYSRLEKNRAAGAVRPGSN